MNKVWSLLPLLAGLAATPGMAQGMGVNGRVEARLGYDEIRSELTVYDDAFTEAFGVSNLNYGVEAGVDGRFDQILVGAYVGIDSSDADNCKNDIVFDGDEACIGAGTNLTAGLRAGLATGDGLIYIKGGYSKSKFKGSYTDEGVELFSDKDNVSGYHIGAGFELDVSSNVYAKAEYVHSRYKDAFDLSDTDADRFNPTRHQILVGVGIRFGATR